MTFAVCILLFITTAYVSVRVVWTKQYNAFVLGLLVLLMIGECAGIATAYSVQRLFMYAYNLKELLKVDPATI
jgi:uncharacterized membrane-anchored protein